MDLIAPAKINLFIQVIGKRPDGYHDLCMLMAAVSLYDRIRLTVKGEQIRLTCDDPDLAVDETNLVWRAAKFFFQQWGRSCGATIALEKRIPIGAGLGGGSSDAAAVLNGLNAHFGQPLSPNQLQLAGRQLGADVPFFIQGRPAFATGIGDVLTPCPFLPPYPVLIIFPAINVSTAAVYRHLNLGLTKCRNRFKNSPLKNQRFDPTQHLCNDLESVTMAWHPQIGEAKALLMHAGALGTLMAGSGSSVFGLFETMENAEQALALIRKRMPENWKLYRAEILTQGPMQDSGG
jgi:4-diphosphocytidyl-2-C-methyl-D-erythritol kinase